MFTQPLLCFKSASKTVVKQISSVVTTVVKAMSLKEQSTEKKEHNTAGAAFSFSLHCIQ